MRQGGGDFAFAQSAASLTRCKHLRELLTNEPERVLDTPATN